MVRFIRFPNMNTWAVLSLALASLMLPRADAVYGQERSGDVLQMLERERKEASPPPPPEKPPVIEFETKEPVIPKLEDGKKVLIKHFVVENDTVLGANKVRSIVAPYENRELNIDEINNVAAFITKAYQNKGYIVTRAYVPPQEIADGVVTIAVTGGAIGAISVEGNKRYSTPFIEGHFQRVKKDPLLNEATLTRQLLILKDFPSLDVKAALRPGALPATTDIVIEAADRFHFAGRMFYDNYGSETTSRSRLGLGFDLGNIVRDGDLINFSGITGLDRIDFNRLAYGRAEYSTPVDYNGTRAGVYYANSVYFAGGDLTPIQLNGYANATGAYLSHPFIKRTDLTFSGRVGFDYKDVYQYLLSDLQSRDPIRTVNGGLSWDVIDRFSGRNLMGFTVTQGIRHILGGIGSSSTNTSRLNADAQFTKYGAEATRFQGLNSYSYLMLRGSAQYSRDELFVAEQFLIGGIGTVRGFSPALKSGDSGYTLTAELYFSPFSQDSTIYDQKIANMLNFFVFGDHGWVRWNNPQPGQDRISYLTSLGAGMKLNVGKHLTVRLDQAVPKEDTFRISRATTYIQTVMSW